MRKLNGITINGEYLGNSVVINGMFRAICTISPVIMRDFVQIINKIERLEDAVKIHNFNCGFDSIDIEFQNTKSKGIASLYFKLNDGEPELKNCKLVIDNQEYKISGDKFVQCKTEEEIKEEERLNKIRELKQRKLDKQKEQQEALQQKQSPIQKPKIGGGLPHPPRPNVSVTPPAELSEEEKKRQKLQEIRDRKRKLLEAQNRDKENPKDNVINSITAEKEEIKPNNTPESDNTVKNDEKIADKINQADNTEKEKTDKETVAETENQDLEKTADNVSDAQKTEETEKTEEKSEETAKDTAEAAKIDTEQNDNSVTEEQDANETNEEIENNTLETTDENIDITEDEFSEEDIDNITIDDNTYNDNGGMKKSLDDYTDEELENMSAEELERLEAELESDTGEYTDNNSNDYGSYEYDNSYGNSYSSDGGQYNGGFNGGFGREFAESLSQGLAEGLAQGLSQGLVQGLQGLQGINFGGGNQNTGLGGFDQSYGSDFSDGDSSVKASQNQQYAPDYGRIDDMNNLAAMSARDDYSYDENSNMDDLSDLYSDFYEEKEQPEEVNEQQQEQVEKKADEQNTSEVDALKAELEALKAETESKKDLMTLDEFMEKQKQLAEAKEKKRRQKFRIVSSKERINASALDNGVFVAGNKVYKWGDTRILDE